MPIYLDSPGFPVILRDQELLVVVPGNRLKVKAGTDFRFDAVTSYLEVNLEDSSRPTLGVYEVYHVLSGDLSLPYSVERVP